MVNQVFFGNPFHSQILVNSRLACSSASHFENFMTFLYGALRASWCFVMLRDASGWDANQRGDSKGWTFRISVLIRSGFGFRRSGGEDAREAWSPCWPSHARPMKTKSVCSVCQICQVKGVEGIASRNRNASGWPEIATARTHNIWGHKIFGARDCWEVPGPESRRSHAGHQVKSADAWKWSIFSWHWCRKRFENISCSDLCLNACFVRGKSP